MIGFYIYKKDREKESVKLLIKLFLGGIGAPILVVIISAVLELVFPIFGAEISDLNLVELAIYTFVGVALVEEFCKWLVAYVFAYNDKEFDELYDAILYCVFVSLGFACIENLLYVYENGIATGIVRAILAVPGHACYGVMMGYFFGVSKIGALNNRKDLKVKNLILSVVVPTIMHGIYDYCVFTENVIFLIIFVIFVIAMFIYVFKKVKKISSINRKMKYNINYCPCCGHEVDGNFCPICGRKNE